jgi:ABC-2 type transport system ATP-binding protein
MGLSGPPALCGHPVLNRPGGGILNDRRRSAIRVQRRYAPSHQKADVLNHPMIEFRNVTRSYGRKVAVDDLSLSIGPGELFALLGPNGAGKTTTIKMLVGLLRPDSGTVRVCGRDVSQDVREASRVIGYVPDQPFLYDKLTGREFLEFVGQMRGLPPALLAERIASQVCNLELGDFLDDLIETYSHGMRQRLVFAAAFLHDPPVLVIDEPLVGLDPRSSRLVKNLLRARTAAGASVLMSTHLLSLAEEIATRIGIVDRGRIKFLGTKAQLQQLLALPHTSLEQLFLQLTEGNHQPARAQGDGAATAVGAVVAAENLPEALPQADWRLAADRRQPCNMTADPDPCDTTASDVQHQIGSADPVGRRPTEEA